MWQNYLIVFLRSILRDRVHATINIVGLAVGVAACVLILLYVRYEFTYDRWMPGAERAFELQDYYRPTTKGGEAYKLQITSYASGVALRKDFPQFDRVVYAVAQSAVVLRDDQPLAIDRAMFVDGPLLDILRIPLTRGDPARALDDPHAVVVSETEARRLFGDAAPLGKTVTLVSGDLKDDYRVTGIFRDLPKNSHLRATMIARFDPLQFFASDPIFLSSWNAQAGYVYARLRPGADIAGIRAQLPAWEKRNIPDEVVAGQKTNAGTDQDWHLTNVRDIHLGEAQTRVTDASDRGAILSFLFAAIAVLGMACINFVNLATARASRRAREVALRKVLGARRSMLIVQFLFEGVMLAGVAAILALALLPSGVGLLNRFLDTDIAFRLWGEGGVLLPMLGLVAVIGIGAGAYPALYISRFEPARILKANRSTDSPGSARLRNLLVIVQFAASIGLIVCTLVIGAQAYFARTFDAGYRRDGLIQISHISDPQVVSVIDGIRHQIAALPEVAAVGRTNIGVGAKNNTTTEIRKPGSEAITIGMYTVDPALHDALGMRLLAGRKLSETIATDDATAPPSTDTASGKAGAVRGVNIILSELAAHRLGFGDPRSAISQPVQLETGPDGWTPATIVGVVNDVRYRTAREPVQPIAYLSKTRGHTRMLVRYRGGDVHKTMADLETVWKRFVPGIPFEARLVDDIVRDLYRQDEERGQMFGLFSMLAIVIACMGLFGLAAFAAEQRAKEIGIRKVLGASTGDIVKLLMWNFSLPILIAGCIAWPVSWWVMRDWLDHFDARISLGPGPFLEALGVALAVALATVATQSYRLARLRPARTLRYE